MDIKNLIYKGYSMYPFFREGDILICRNINLGSLRIGDIPVVLQEGSAKIYVHRIITASENRFITKGDNLFHADSEKNKILGKVIAINRNGRLNFLTNRKGRLIAILSKYNITPIISNFHAITICRRLKKLYWKRRPLCEDGEMKKLYWKRRRPINHSIIKYQNLISKLIRQIPV